MHWSMPSMINKWDVFSFGLVLLQVVWGRNYSTIPTERELLEKPVEEKIDFSIKGNISPECWQVFIDISVRCLNLEPTMSEVESNTNPTHNTVILKKCRYKEIVIDIVTIAVVMLL
ncbi:hypothetical protein CR513_15801, partial [Mucuna pruriens]